MAEAVLELFEFWIGEVDAAVTVVAEADNAEAGINTDDAAETVAVVGDAVAVGVVGAAGFCVRGVSERRGRHSFAGHPARWCHTSSVALWNQDLKPTARLNMTIYPARSWRVR